MCSRSLLQISYSSLASDSSWCFTLSVSMNGILHVYYIHTSWSLVFLSCCIILSCYPCFFLKKSIQLNADIYYSSFIFLRYFLVWYDKHAMRNSFRVQRGYCLCLFVLKIYNFVCNRSKSVRVNNRYRIL